MTPNENNETVTYKNAAIGLEEAYADEIFRIRKELFRLVYSVECLNADLGEFEDRPSKDKRRAIDTVTPLVDELKRVSSEVKTCNVMISMLCNKDAKK